MPNLSRTVTRFMRCRVGRGLATLLLCLLAAGTRVSAQSDDTTGHATPVPSAAGAPAWPDGSPRATASAQPGRDDASDWREILPGLTMGSQLRLRTERRHNFRFDDTRPGNEEGFLLSRFRFDLDWEPNALVRGFVELQDARIVGEDAINESRTPNIFADQLDVHQAYLDVKTPAATRVPVTFRLGRQKIAYGTQRLVSPLEWVNTARVFDAAKVGVGLGPGRSIDGFASRLVPVAPTDFNDHGPTASRMFNSQLYGVYINDARTVARTKLEGYWLLRRETRMADAVHTVGARVDATLGAWAVDGEVAGQRGTFGGDDHRSMMVHVGGAYTLTLPGRPQVGAAFNYGGGDDDPTDGVHRTFDNLYPLNHAFYGYMDFFALQNLRNTELTVETRLPRRAVVRVDYHFFSLVAPGTDAWYNAGAGIVHRADDAAISSNVGRELDITLRVPVGPVGMELGYGHFFGGAYLREADFALQSADFFYLQTVVGF